MFSAAAISSDPVRRVRLEDLEVHLMARLASLPLPLRRVGQEQQGLAPDRGVAVLVGENLRAIEAGRLGVDRKSVV